MAKKFLIIKLSALGDVIHALPTATALKKAYPACHISWVVSPAAQDFVKACPDIDEVIIFERQSLNSLSKFCHYIKPFAHILKQKNYDCCFDLQGLLKSALIAFLCRAQKKIGYADLREGSNLISKAICGKNAKGHIIERYLDTVRSLGVEVSNADLNLKIDAAIKEHALQLLPSNMQEKLHFCCAFIVGTNWPNKCWPPAHFAALAKICQKQGITPILFGAGKSDFIRAQEILDKSDGNIISLVGKTSLLETATLIKKVRFCLGGDTGMMHLAAGLKRPVIMLMGPTDPVRNGPYGQIKNVLTVPYECRFCWKRRCQFKRDCLSCLSPETVAAKLSDLGLFNNE